MTETEFLELELGQYVWMARSTSIDMYKIIGINYPRRSNQPRLTKRTVQLQSTRDSHIIDLILPEDLHTSFFIACKAVVDIGEANDNADYYEDKEYKRMSEELTGSDNKYSRIKNC